MEKLKRKTFIVIFSILTIFLISILCIFNYQDYKHEKTEINNNLNKINRRNENIEFNIEKNKEEDQNPNSQTKIETNKIIILGIEGLAIAILIKYIALSKFNKLKKETT